MVGAVLATGVDRLLEVTGSLVCVVQISSAIAT